MAFVQDHLVQRGGGDRILLSMLRAVPTAQVFVAFYDPDESYPEFADETIRTSPLNRVRAIRKRHRATFPLMPAIMSATKVDADVVVCGTSGWAQGVRTDGRKVVYFHAPTRWLYEREAYLKGAGVVARAAAHALGPVLRPWDRRTMASGHRFLAASTSMCTWMSELYGVDVGLLRYPNNLGATGSQTAVPGVEPGFFLCVARLTPYKNVDVLVDAFAAMPGERLVVAGDGPLMEEIAAVAPPNVSVLGACDDGQLRSLYASCDAVISSAFEPFGLTPIEGGAFGKPTVALRAGGFLDTVVEGVTGAFFDAPEPRLVVDAVARFRSMSFDRAAVEANAAQWDEDAFGVRLRAVIEEERSQL